MASCDVPVKTVRKAATHPAYATMVSAAVEMLNAKGGSSRVAILKYVIANYSVGPSATAVNGHVKRALCASVANGTLLQAQGTGATGRFRLPKPAKPSIGKPARKPAPAADAGAKPAPAADAGAKRASAADAGAKPVKRKPAAKSPTTKKTTRKVLKSPTAGGSKAKKPARFSSTPRPSQTPAKKKRQNMAKVGKKSGRRYSKWVARVACRAELSLACVFGRHKSTAVVSQELYDLHEATVVFVYNVCGPRHRYSFDVHSRLSEFTGCVWLKLCTCI